MKRIQGFSMVEVLLALAIGGLVLMAASALLVTISQAWANRLVMHLRLHNNSNKLPSKMD